MRKTSGGSVKAMRVAYANGGRQQVRSPFQSLLAKALPAEARRASNALAWTSRNQLTHFVEHRLSLRPAVGQHAPIDDCY